MLLERIVSEGISHNSYYVGSGLDAAVIDPRRDVDIYLHLAKRNSQKITHIFESHRNEDYVVGSLELSKLTGARIIHGSKLDFSYGVSAREGDAFNIGSLEFGVLETPGHTDESISLTVKDLDTSTDIFMVFTGDTLFAGDVGRTDLYGEDHRRKLSGDLYDSLFNKLLKIGDEVIVLPGHGAGSVCGANIGLRDFTTIGYERKTNPALKNKTREAFIQFKMKEVLETPPYFKKMEQYNRLGPPIIKLPDPESMSVSEIKRFEGKDCLMVDLRMPEAFASGHIPNSLSIWKNGLPLFAGWILNYSDPIILIKEEDQDIGETVRYLYRLGFDNIAGYLHKGIASWYRNGEQVTRNEVWSVHDLKKNLSNDDLFILDVRDSKSYLSQGYIKRANHIYIGHLKNRLPELPKNKTICVYCDSGFKTGIAISILSAAGFRSVIGVLGGFNAWSKSGYPVEKAVSPV